MQLKSDAFNIKYTNVKKYHTHKKKVGHVSEFLLVFINELKKQLFITLKTTINFEKNEKHCCRYHHFTQNYQKPQSHEVQFLRYGVRQAESFFTILPP